MKRANSIKIESQPGLKISHPMKNCGMDGRHTHAHYYTSRLRNFIKLTPSWNSFIKKKNHSAPGKKKKQKIRKCQPKRGGA